MATTNDARRRDSAASPVETASAVFTTRFIDFAAYLIASGDLPYRGARLSSAEDDQHSVVFWFEDTQNVGRDLIRLFYQHKGKQVDAKVLLDAQRFIKQETTRVRNRAAEVR